jgi:hypothetical protein
MNDEEVGLKRHWFGLIVLVFSIIGIVSTVNWIVKLFIK